MKRGEANQEPILIVDDDELLRWSAAERLRECGYHVEVAAGACDALEHCPSTAVALLNHDPPVADGLAVAAALRACCPGCTVVLMTADPTSELRRRAEERGIARVLGKPFSLEDLVDAIRDALGQGRTAGLPPAGAVSGRRRQTEAPGRV